MQSVTEVKALCVTPVSCVHIACKNSQWKRIADLNIFFIFPSDQEISYADLFSLHILVAIPHCQCRAAMENSGPFIQQIRLNMNYHWKWLNFPQTAIHDGGHVYQASFQSVKTVQVERSKNFCDTDEPTKQSTNQAWSYLTLQTDTPFPNFLLWGVRGTTNYDLKKNYNQVLWTK